VIGKLATPSGVSLLLFDCDLFSAFSAFFVVAIERMLDLRFFSPCGFLLAHRSDGAD
jgi:hypothetical protein